MAELVQASKEEPALLIDLLERVAMDLAAERQQPGDALRPMAAPLKPIGSPRSGNQSPRAARVVAKNSPSGAVPKRAEDGATPTPAGDAAAPAQAAAVDRGPAPSVDRTLGTPLEQAQAFLKDLKAYEGGQSSEVDTGIDFVSALLDAPADERYKPVEIGNEQDDETLRYISGETAEEKAPPIKTLKRVTNMFRLSFRLNKSASRHFTSILSPALKLPEHREMELLKVLAGHNSWDFDVFRVAELTGGRTLQAVGYTVFTRSELMEKFGIHEATLINFLRIMEENYRGNAYHNATHAADVLQTLSYFIVTGEFDNNLSEVQVLAMYVAAVIHDVDHPGTNNAFQVVNETPLAIAHNDHAVLESHSLAHAFALMSDAENNCDILSGLQPEQRRLARDTIIKLVLATDMAQHFESVGKMKARIGAAETYTITDDDDRVAFMRLVLKAADISNPAKPMPIYKQWVTCVMDEFWSQGDLERERGMPISPFFDREKPHIAKCQSGFGKYLVQPLYDIIKTFVKNVPVDILEANIAHFSDLAERE